MAVNYMEFGTLKEKPAPQAFFKNSHSVIGPDETMTLPDVPASIVEAEAELALVIGKKAKNVKPEEAYDYIFGYLNFADGSGSFTGKFLDLQKNGVSQLVVEDTGKVGIGTATPQAKLEVNGAVMVGTTATACSDTIDGSIRYNDGTNVMEACLNTTWTNLAAVGDPSYGTAGGSPADAVYVDAAGEVGVGTTTPSSPLHVAGPGMGGAGVPIFHIEDDNAGSDRPGIHLRHHDR